jgi:chemotaxis protein methyltransferase CheR
MMDLSHVRFHAARRRAPVARRHPGPATDAAPSDELGHAELVRGLPALVLARAGLNPAAYRAAPLRRRVGACLRAIRAESEGAACARVDRDEAAHGAALNSLLIGVSSFFRDAEVWDALRTSVIPGLVRQRSDTIRVLSVGCSLGAELHSVAMLLAEAGALHRAELVGVDCRPRAVATASAAVFDEDLLSGVTPDLRARYVEPAVTAWRIIELLRRQATWKVMDATRDLPEGPWDLVLCRNLLMYLRSCVADTMYRRMVASLAPGGSLVLGKAERPPASLHLTPVGRCIHRFDGA